MAICSNQKAPESSSSPGGPTSADIKRKLMEVLDNLSDTASIAAISKAITQPGETPQTVQANHTYHRLVQRISSSKLTAECWRGYN